MKLIDHCMTLKPLNIECQNWHAREFFRWEPDIFAFCSIWLEMGGWYRYVTSVPPSFESYTSPPDKDDTESLLYIDWKNQQDWLQNMSKLSKLWDDWISGNERGSSFEKIINEFESVLRKHSLSQFDFDLFDIKQPQESTSVELMRLSVVLTNLAICADNLCGNYGGMCRRHNDRVKRVYMANIRLSLSYSLSRIPKVFGAVLPKSRTPQTGMTLHSLTHHLGFIRSETDVIWRSLPWLNSAENTVNILIVPHPDTIEKHQFKPEYHSQNIDSYDPTRYFSYQLHVSEEETLSLAKRMVSLVRSAQKSHCKKVHMLVLPELALTTKSLNAIKLQFLDDMLDGEDHLKSDQVPMIVAGVSDWQPARISPSTDESCEIQSRSLSGNTAVLSVFFGGKWYDMYQSKHHRWKLDRGQIDTYGLSGILTGEGSWWESMPIRKRKLAMLSANGWLTMCPLICEDLARIEPVSRVIRTIGPNLVIALLLDAPQLKSRWPARYATVLAEDPGSSVLTVTARGMCRLSQPKNNSRHIQSEKQNTVIALWKDASGNFIEIGIEDEAEAVLLTVDASYGTEHSADGRSDHGMSAVLRFRNSQQVFINDSEKALDSENSPKEKTYVEEKVTSLSKFDDLSDLSLLNFYVNACLFEYVEQLPIALSEPKSKQNLGATNRDKPERTVEALTALSPMIEELKEWLNYTSNRDWKNRPCDQKAVTQNLLSKLNRTMPEWITFVTYQIIYTIKKVHEEKKAYITSVVEGGSESEKESNLFHYLQALTDQVVDNIDKTKGPDNLNEETSISHLPVSDNCKKYLKVLTEFYSTRNTSGFDKFKKTEIRRINITTQLLFLANIHKFYSASKQRNYNGEKAEKLLVKIESCFQTVTELSAKIAKFEKASIHNTLMSFTSSITNIKT